MDLKSLTEVSMCNGWTTVRILLGGDIVVHTRMKTDRRLSSCVTLVGSIVYTQTSGLRGWRLVAEAAF